MTDARSTIVQLASEMEESGLYRGWRAIEARLRADGLAHVRAALDDRCQTRATADGLSDRLALNHVSE